MRVLALLQLFVSTCFISEVWGAQQPVRNLQITLRGKKYDVDDAVTTVRDLQEKMKEAAGITSPQSVLFEGKRLDADDVLSQVGVTDGAQLNMVPATGGTTSNSGSSKTKVKTTASGSADSTIAGAAGDSSLSSIDAAMQEYMKQAGVDTDKLSELVKGLGGGEGGAMPSMKESLEMMNDMVKSDIFQSYMNDPAKLEESRQMILNNPMLKSMMAGMPGMAEVLNDPDAWREAMQAASNMYKNMDPDMLMSMMSGAAGGAGAAMPPGLFDGTLDQSAAAAALDELDEDE